MPAAKASGGVGAPALLDGGVVQQTLWEVRIPWSEAVVGVPAGWTDENEWYWDAYVWKRRPWKTSAGLAVGSAVRPPAPAPTAGTDADADPRGDYHSYLFGRPGGPAGLPLRIASRAWLVAVCSGSVLAVGGLLILVWRPPVRAGLGRRRGARPLGRDPVPPERDVPGRAVGDGRPVSRPPCWP